MRLRLLWTAVTLVILLAQAAEQTFGADKVGTAATSTTPSLSSQFPVTPSPGYYKLKISDELQIEVIGLPDLTENLKILPDGKITLKIAGSIHCAGLTVSELEKTITQKYREYLKNPNVRVTVVNFQRASVNLLGQVRTQGPVAIQAGFSLRDYIVAAGGFLENADISRITVTKASGSVDTVDLSGSQIAELPVIEEGDTILVPEAKGLVSVLGRVNKPGAVPARPMMKLSDAFSDAGGGFPDSDLSRVEVVSGGIRQIYNLKQYLEQADLTQNPPLTSGDVVFVPESRQLIYLYGAVNKPGPYIFDENQRLMDAVFLAGGFSPQANTKDAALVRNENGKVVQKTIDLQKYMQKGDIASNPPLEPGDIIYIAERSQARSLWQQALEPLLVLSSIRTVLFR